MDEIYLFNVFCENIAYGAIRAENQNLLSTISELKTRLEKVEKVTFFTNSRTSKSLETTFVAPKTRFSEKETQSKTLDTTY
ncbi:hypothetical protein Tco_1506186 [Tanacetum coccineum]